MQLATIVCYTSFAYFIHSLLPVQYPPESWHTGLVLGQSPWLAQSMNKRLETYEKLLYGKIWMHKLTLRFTISLLFMLEMNIPHAFLEAISPAPSVP